MRAARVLSTRSASSLQKLPMETNQKQQRYKTKANTNCRGIGVIGFWGELACGVHIIFFVFLYYVCEKNDKRCKQTKKQM